MAFPSLVVWGENTGYQLVASFEMFCLVVLSSLRFIGREGDVRVEGM